MAGFLTGFAEGYTDERKRVLDQKAQKEQQESAYKHDENQIRLRFQLEDAQSARKEREAQIRADRERAENALTIAKSLGRPEAAEEIGGLLKANMTTEQILKNYEINPDTPVNRTIVVPDGVRNPVVEKAPIADIPGAKKSFDTQVVTPNSITTPKPIVEPELPEQSPSGLLRLKTQLKKVEEVGTLKQVLYEVETAKTPEEKAKAELKLKVSQQAANQEALAKARAERKDVERYVMIDEKGKMIGNSFVGRRDEEGNLINEAMDGEHVVVKGNQKAVVLSEDTVKTMDDIAKDFGQKTTKYSESLTKFTGAISSAKRFDEILRDHSEVNSYSAYGAQIITKIGEELTSFNKVFSGGEDPMDRFKEAALAGDYNTASEIVGDVENMTKELENKLDSGEVRDAAYYAALAESYKIQTAMQLAQSMGILKGNASNKDIERIFQQIGEGNIADTMRDTIASNIGNVSVLLKSEQKNLSESIRPRLETLKISSGGIDFGLEPTRVQNHVKEILGPDGESYFLKSTSNLRTPEVIDTRSDQSDKNMLEFKTSDGPIKMTTDQYNRAVAALREDVQNDPENSAKYIKEFDEGFGQKGLAQKELGGR